MRDRYNNPVSGATVHFTLAGAEQGTSHELDNGTTTGEAVQVTTGADGQASVTYHLDSVSGNGDDVTVRVSIDDIPPMGGSFDTDRKETLAFSLAAVGQSGNGNGGNGDGGDGGDGGGGDDGAQTPQVEFRVDDLSHPNEDKMNYVASYDVSNTNGSFERVNVVYDNVNRGSSATGTRSATTMHGSQQYQLSYGASEQWKMTVQVIYERSDRTE